MCERALHLIRNRKTIIGNNECKFSNKQHLFLNFMKKIKMVETQSNNMKATTDKNLNEYHHQLSEIPFGKIIYSSKDHKNTAEKKPATRVSFSHIRIAFNM